MNRVRLRTRLVVLFVAATVAPLLLTLWISLNLLDRSLELSPASQIDELSRAVEGTGRELYHQARERLKVEAASGRLPAVHFGAAQQAGWPQNVAEFWASGEPERFALGGNAGDRLDYLARRDKEVLSYSLSLNGVRMGALSSMYAKARAVVERRRGRDLRRGFTLTLLVVAGAIWICALAALIYWANRITAPIRELTKGLAQVAAGRLEYRVAVCREDEAGRAIVAFNEMAEQLEETRDRLVYMTRLESWQALARKMAHEIKNSLTPIRLTVEEVAARGGASDAEFLQQAAQIVVDEVTSLERRVRAFTEFSSEPPVAPRTIDVNAMLEERIALLRAAHPEVTYTLRLAEESPNAYADEDLLKGVLTNLLENAAQAATSGGMVMGMTNAVNGHVRIEVHDSGPGLSVLARATLFEPTISFKEGGMGLGLSIAKKSAVLSGGDIELVQSELGGAGFRVILPRVA